MFCKPLSYETAVQPFSLLCCLSHTLSSIAHLHMTRSAVSTHAKVFAGFATFRDDPALLLWSHSKSKPWPKRFAMELILIIVVLVLLFGGGGGYFGRSRGYWW